MSRLASFKGPSTPSSSPVRPPPVNSPSSPSRLSETTYHRKVRILLRELRGIAQTWDDLVLVDGLRAAQGLVDSRTELDNELTLLPANCLPPVGLLSSKMDLMEKKLKDLDSVILKLHKQFDRMVTVVDNLEAGLFEAQKTKGWKWVNEEPLWCTWTLAQFATKIPTLLPSYHRSLREMKVLVTKLGNHDVSFEISRDVLAKWVAQSWLQDGGWWSDWEDLCSVEVERWESNR